MLGREFPRHASEWDGDDDGVSRRRFLELSGASLALAGLTACVKQPREGLVPYVKQPEEVVPGRPLFFATGFTLGGLRHGHPRREQHGPPHEGGREPAAPREPRRDGRLRAGVDPLALRPRPLADDHEARPDPHVAGLRRGASGARQDEPGRSAARASACSRRTVTSPALAAKIRELLAILPKARWHQWEPAGRDPVRAGARLAFGQPVEIRYDFAKADVVVSLDADPFTFGPGLARARARVRAAPARGRDRRRRRLPATTRSRRRPRAPGRSPTTASP